LAEILLDSDVIIAWLRGSEPYVESIPELLDQGNSLFWTPVSIAEIYAGVRKSEERDVEGLFLIFEAVPTTYSIGVRAGRYLSLYRKSHGMELGDALIAATASITGVPLWTLNKKHYPPRDTVFYEP
jgi:predicted nucleic acid-binding protein